MDYATIDDVISLWRRLSPDETERAKSLLPIVTDTLRIEAQNVGKDLDELAKDNRAYRSVLKSVIVDIVGRTLLTSTEEEPMTQQTQSALGYSWSGSYLVPGGGLFIKKSELAKLGLRRQRFGGVDIYDIERSDSNFN